MQVVADGIEAQELALNPHYDLVILDLGLPGAMGLDVLRGIRSKTADLSVLIVATVEERVGGLDAGADDYVAKPFVFAELSARIRAVLRRGSRPGARRSADRGSRARTRHPRGSSWRSGNRAQPKE